MIFKEAVDCPKLERFTIKTDLWSVIIDVSEDGAKICDGSFGQFALIQSSLFTMKLKDLNGRFYTFDSSQGWKKVCAESEKDSIRITFYDYKNFSKICVELVGKADENGISWHTNVINNSTEFAAEYITYTTPAIKGEEINLFAPDRSGRAIMNVGVNGFDSYYPYPGFYLSMQYFAYWGKKNGLYLGIHDPNACFKEFNVLAKDNEAKITAWFAAIGAGTVANSFSVGGFIRWQFFVGDWYDATLIYREFVYKDAKWLSEKGRPDTASKFKEIGMWAKYNGTEAFHESSTKGLLQLREKMGVPIAAHPYSWHKIIFDVDYPHYMPAKKESIESFKAFKEADIYVAPYINAVSWDTKDGDSGYEMNFDNTGVHGVAIYPDGNKHQVDYGSKRPNGDSVYLAAICPGYSKWHEIIEDLVRDMEKNLPIDGVYFDQVAALEPVPCHSTEHGHIPGGGSYWTELYNEMMEKIKKNRPAESFYFTECNGEGYLKAFDGFLTWQWNLNDLVPAYCVIYSGYIQLVGRHTECLDEDENYFRYHFAEAVLYGQQPGWFGAREDFDEDRLNYMKKAVDFRMANLDFFNKGVMLRPPVVESGLEWFSTSECDLKNILVQAWKSEDSSKTVIMIANISEKKKTVKLKFSPNEYGVSGNGLIDVELEPYDLRSIEL